MKTLPGVAAPPAAGAGLAFEIVKSKTLTPQISRPAYVRPSLAPNIVDSARLHVLHRAAIRCADLESFVKDL